MALFPNRLDTANRTNLPMARMLRYGMPHLSDPFSGPPLRTWHGPPQQPSFRDRSDSRLYPHVFHMLYEGFRIRIKVSMGDYKPEDVKLEIRDTFLVLEAKHEERKEKHCYVSREFIRRICLPRLACVDDVNAEWSAQGWLSIYIPLKQTPIGLGFYSPSGNQRPIKSGAKPPKPKVVRPVPMRIEEY